MKNEREQRDPGGEHEVVLARHVQPLDVLPGDLRVRADVDDVDPPNVLLEVLDGLGDQPACDERLAKPDLVGDEESRRRVGPSA